MSRRSLTKRAGSGARSVSGSQRYGSQEAFAMFAVYGTLSMKRSSWRRRTWKRGSPSCSGSWRSWSCFRFAIPFRYPLFVVCCSLADILFLRMRYQDLIGTGAAGKTTKSRWKTKTLPGKHLCGLSQKENRESKELIFFHDKRSYWNCFKGTV